MATIWRGGCIRAQFLNRIRDADAEHGDVENLPMVPYFTDAVANAQDAWRRVIVTAPSRAWPSPRSPARWATTTATAANGARRT